MRLLAARNLLSPRWLDDLTIIPICMCVAIGASWVKSLRARPSWENLGGNGALYRFESYNGAINLKRTWLLSGDTERWNNGGPLRVRAKYGDAYYGYGVPKRNLRRLGFALVQYEYPIGGDYRSERDYSDPSHSRGKVIARQISPPRAIVGSLQVSIPYWFLLVCAGLPLVVQLRRVRKWRRARRPGLCARCGYDLRATPTRCPECGRINTPTHDPDITSSLPS